MTDSLVVIFKGISQYQSLNTMASELAEAYRSLGYRASLIDLQAIPDHVQLKRLIVKALNDDRLHLIVTISGYGLDTSQTNNIYTGVGVPVLSLYFDPLILYANQIDLPISPRVITTTADTDLDYWAPVRAGGATIRHLPHAAAPQPIRSGRRRTGSLVFAGTGSECPDVIRNEWHRHGPMVADRLNRIVELALADTALRALSGIIAEAIGGEIEVRDPLALHPYFATIDGYLRARQRWRLVTALADQPLVVLGEGWERLADHLKDRPKARVRFLPPRDVSALESLIGRAPLVLNACTPHHGSHERVLRAMALGTAALTSRTRWFAREAPADALIQVDLERDDVRAVVEEALSTPGRIDAIAEAGSRWFREHHTWSHRVATLEAWLAEPG